MPKIAPEKFPTGLYVHWEEPEGGTPYPAADEEPTGEDGQRIAIYELKQVKTKKIVESLV